MKEIRALRWQSLITAAAIPIIFLFPAALTFAQVPKKISAGVINGKVIKMSRPEYPPAARAVQASGAVNVQVTVDETGKVVSAFAVSGHPLLKKAAETAAKSAEFKPFMLKGEAFKATGILVFNFNPDAKPTASKTTDKTGAQKDESTKTEKENVEDDKTDKATTAENRGLTQEIIRGYIRSYEERVNPTGGVGSPGAIDVTFGDIQFGAPRAANTEDQLRGAKFGALYPVTVRYTLIKKFRNENVPTNKTSIYEFYQNAQGVWEAMYIGPAQ